MDCCGHPDIQLMTEDGYECLNCGRMFGHRLESYHQLRRLTMYTTHAAEQGRRLGELLRSFGWASAAKR